MGNSPRRTYIPKTDSRKSKKSEQTLTNREHLSDFFSTTLKDPGVCGTALAALVKALLQMVAQWQTMS